MLFWDSTAQTKPIAEGFSHCQLQSIQIPLSNQQVDMEFPSSSFLDSDRVPCGSRSRRWTVSPQLPQNTPGSTALSGELRIETRTESKVQRALLQGGKISIY